MRFNLSAAAAVLLTASVFLPGAALASCIQGICVTGRDDGDVHFVQFSQTLGNYITHFNLSIPGSAQRQLGPNETQFTVPLGKTRPVTIHFSLQACDRRGLFRASSCTPWVNFSHTAN